MQSLCPWPSLQRPIKEIPLAFVLGVPSLFFQKGATISFFAVGFLFVASVSSLKSQSTKRRLSLSSLTCKARNDWHLPFLVFVALRTSIKERTQGPSF